MIRGITIVLFSFCVLWCGYCALVHWPVDYYEMQQTAIIHVVQPGETLWGIAERYYPEQTLDRRYVVWVIRKINNLQDADGPVIHPGQPVLVPSQLDR